MDRPRFATVTVMNEPRPVWPMNSPAGTAITSAAITEIADSTTCSVVRLMIPVVPVQFDGSANQAATWLIRSTRRPSSPPGPRRREPPEPEDREVQDDRQRDRQDRPDVDRRRVAEAEAAQHHLSE